MVAAAAAAAAALVMISEFCVLEKVSSLFIIGELTAECNITKQAT